MSACSCREKNTEIRLTLCTLNDDHEAKDGKNDDNDDVDGDDDDGGGGGGGDIEDVDEGESRNMKKEDATDIGDDD
ncbi:hypothetical protein ElyMa_002628200 [Elysia marginata]|uniref:Uncharacterized protein n=1 Tax=Elysia marginata TaxID=1093978 RepID=A0AAV4H5Q9_9GAST|nr:hypothetical protein ElyMa_002628200 [Elysia marginata]